MAQPVSLSEFSIISRYFNRPGLSANQSEHSFVRLGIGDDCALIKPSPNKLLAVSLDVLNTGVHFPENAPADLIAQRALAVNLSDVAAMGATPVGFTLGLSLPEVDEAWLEKFSEGLSFISQTYQCPLIGGDLTLGPLSIAIQAHGEVDGDKALTRSGAKAGDLVYVSGQLGAAAAALEVLDKENKTSLELKLMEAFYKPVPRIELGQKLQSLASSCIDISDGLLADLAHIAESSSVTLEIEAHRVPVNTLLKEMQTKQSSLMLALTGGDDYELAFTIPPEYKKAVVEVAEQAGCQLSCIGRVLPMSSAGETKETVRCLDEYENVLEVQSLGYQHF